MGFECGAESVVFPVDVELFEFLSAVVFEFGALRFDWFVVDRQVVLADFDDLVFGVF